ncbi:hypothetical protein Tco_0910601 [Tanacetum coccineum]|uniref:Uncharacterized protein n=1 Tax=Tanacetum coccineum TaxID=301880 RepID=A0ABQ5CTC2_9ASTR
MTSLNLLKILKSNFTHRNSMELSSSNSEERELQRMQREERELHKKCLTWFKKLKIHLGNLHKFFEVRNTRPLEIAYRILFHEEHQTFREKMYHHLNQLQWQLKRDKFQGHDSKTFLDVLKTQFKEFFNSKDVNALDFHNKSWKKTSKILRFMNPKLTDLRMKEREVHAIQETEKRLKEREIQQQESLVTEDAVMEACLVTEDTTLEANLSIDRAALDASLVTEEMDDNSVVKESTDDSVTSSKQLDESSSSWNNADADIGPSYDSDTVSEVHHDMFENVFAHGIQNHEQPESITDTYMVNENNNNIIFDIPNMDLDRGKEEHDDVDYEQQRAFFASLIKNLKCDVKKCNKTDQTLRMLLPKEDNVQSRKQGLGFENKNDVENPCLLNKAKELAPCLYNIEEMGKDELSDHKIILEEELKCEAEKFKSESHSHVYENAIFEQNSSLENENHCLKNTKTDLSKQAADVKEEMTKRCAQYKKENVKLEAYFISLEHNSQNKSSTSKQNGHVLNNRSGEVKIKFDTKDLEIVNIEVEYSVTSLLKENKHLKKIYQNLFDSIKRSQVQIKNDSDPSNVESESMEKRIIFEMTLDQQTKDFEDAKVDFSKKMDKFETYFEKLKKTRVVLKQQLDRKIQDSKAEKD